jgi:hypothetical protein
MLTLKPFRRAAVPLVAVSTADPAGVLRLALAEARNGTTQPVLCWDVVNGIRPANDEARTLADTLNGNQEPAIATGNPVEALRALTLIGNADTMRAQKPVAVLYGLADVLADPQAGLAARQALWNLRDLLPQTGAIVVCTVPLGWRNPLPNDIATVADPLPDRAKLIALAGRLAEAAGIQAPDAETAEKCADAMIGLSGFAAEQALALSVRKAGIDLETLWTRKRQQIAETPGLSVYAGTERFSDLGGLDQAKQLFGRLVKGKRKPGAVVFIDEIEKTIGTAGDTSGVSQGMLGYLLSYMQDTNATGAIFVGPPGAAKSAFAKAVGNEAEIPTVSLDLGGIKGSLVGESEGRMRTALAVITAVSGGRPLFLATCNAIADLPPELRRRFTTGTMFFDLPTETEREAIWPIYTAKYQLDDQARPQADGWTGAEIRQCCDLADKLGMTVQEAAGFVVPVAISAAEKIERLRTEANGKYLSAGAAGIYQKRQAKTTGRRMEV